MYLQIGNFRVLLKLRMFLILHKHAIHIIIDFAVVFVCITLIHVATNTFCIIRQMICEGKLSMWSCLVTKTQS